MNVRIATVDKWVIINNPLQNVTRVMDDVVEGTSVRATSFFYLVKEWRLSRQKGSINDQKRIKRTGF